jgi:benzoyl-CoA reductase subunit B
MKELRRMHFRNTWDAHDRSEVVIQGLVEQFLAYFAGMGDFANPSFGPYFTTLMRDHQAGIRVHEAAEAAGYGSNCCTAMRCHLGQMLQGLSSKNPKGGTMKADMVFQFSNCPAISKMAQIFAEHMDIPHFIIDMPYSDTPESRDYLVSMMQEGIEWMEKITGRRYDDQKLFQALKNEWDAGWYLAKVYEANKAIPAPFDYRQLWSLRLPSVIMRHKNETVQFYRDLLAEAEERVKQGISAHGVELCRLTHEGLPPFYNMNIFRYPVRYGAVVVAGMEVFASFAVWRRLEDGTWRAAPTWDELLGELRIEELRTREDALRVMAEEHIRYLPNGSYPYDKPAQYVKRVEDWKAGGVIFHLDRGCRGASCGLMEGRLAVSQAGIPNVTYEASQADCRDYDEAQITDRLDSFLESLGLDRTEISAESPG